MNFFFFENNVEIVNLLNGQNIKLQIYRTKKYFFFPISSYEEESENSGIKKLNNCLKYVSKDFYTTKFSSITLQHQFIHEKIKEISDRKPFLHVQLLYDEIVKHSYKKYLSFINFFVAQKKKFGENHYFVDLHLSIQNFVSNLKSSRFYKARKNFYPILKDLNELGVIIYTQKENLRNYIIPRKKIFLLFFIIFFIIFYSYFYFFFFFFYF